jgi:predicted nuclease of predicted toxin-antitoxin system
VKLLFDQNLSRHLVELIADVFAGSEHVGLLNLGNSTDTEIRKFAADKNFVIVSKDSDFYHHSFVKIGPPKVIWLKVGNQSTSVIEQLIRRYVLEIQDFGMDIEKSVLVLEIAPLAE